MKTTPNEPDYRADSIIVLLPVCILQRDKIQVTISVRVGEAEKQTPAIQKPKKSRLDRALVSAETHLLGLGGAPVRESATADVLRKVVRAYRTGKVK